MATNTNVDNTPNAESAVSLSEAATSSNEASARSEQYAEPPPSYSEKAEDECAGSSDQDAKRQHVMVNMPLPEYKVAAELPTYEEAARIKDAEERGLPPPVISPRPRQDDIDGVGGRRGQFLRLALYPRGDLESSDVVGSSTTAAVVDGDDVLLGNDFVFFTAFLTAFLFNWIGFLLLMCFCHTVAARYGALAGFGLSLTKWTLIIKRSSAMNGGREALGSSENAWLWWLIMAFGLLICFRAIVQYLHLKRIWRGLSVAARERFFFFY